MVDILTASKAARFAFRRNDVIIALDGVVGNVGNFVAKLEKHRTGSKVIVTVLRDQLEHRLTWKVE